MRRKVRNKQGSRKEKEMKKGRNNDIKERDQERK
jgi:hypothetical protein